METVRCSLSLGTQQTRLFIGAGVLNTMVLWNEATRTIVCSRGWNARLPSSPINHHPAPNPSKVNPIFAPYLAQTA